MTVGRSHPEANRGTCLSFVVPVFNELDGLPALWDALCSAGAGAVRSGRVGGWEAVLVDDGSSDGSGAAIEGLARDDARCRVVHHEANAGIGAALHSGFQASRGDVVVYTDADLPWDLRRLGELLDPVLRGEVDLVAGRRMGRSNEGRWRAVQSVTYNLVVRVVFGLRVSDANFACKVADRSALPLTVRSRSGFFDAEWLIWAHHQHLRIREVPVAFVPRRWGRSSVDRSEAGAILRDLVAHRRRRRTRSRVEPTRPA